MRHTMTTRNDLRNWVDTATSGWDVRGDTDVEDITAAIHRMDTPRWGEDWTEFLKSLPELYRLLPVDRQ